MPAGVEFYPTGPIVGDEASQPRSYPIVLTGEVFLMAFQIYCFAFTVAVLFKLCTSFGDTIFFLPFTSLILKFLMKQMAIDPKSMLAVLHSVIKLMMMLP